MTKRKYYRQLVGHIIKKSWHISDTIASIVALIIPPLTQRFFPEWGARMADLVWQIPLFFLATLTIVRGFLAPYWMYQEREQEIEVLQNTHGQTEDALHQQIFTLKDQLDTLRRHREQREALARYLTRGNELINIYASPGDVPSKLRDEWAYGVANYLRTSFDKSYFARWNDSTGITSHFSTNKEVSKENERFLRDIYWRILRLHELIADLKD